MTPGARPASWELPPHRVAAEGSPPSRAWEYVAIRVTGVLLSVLVLGHFAVTHFVNDVAHDNATFVTRQLSSVLWVSWDTAMLAAGLAHGAIGVRLALRDYASQSSVRTLGRLVGVVSLALLAVGVAAIARSAHV